MKNPKSSNTKQKILKKIHTVGFWLNVLGVLYIVLTPLIEFIFYTKASSKGYSKDTMVIASIVLGLILGCIFFRLGMKIKKISLNDFKKTNKLLLYSAIYIVFVVVLGLVGGGLKGITGLLDLITFVQIILARSQIKKLGIK